MNTHKHINVEFIVIEQEPVELMTVFCENSVSDGEPKSEHEKVHCCPSSFVLFVCLCVDVCLLTEISLMDLNVVIFWHLGNPMKPVSVFLCLCLCPCFCLPSCLCLSVGLSSCLCLSVSLSSCLCLSVCLSVYTLVCLYRSVH